MSNTFEVKSGKIVVTDPCYDRDTHEENWVVPAKKGTWVGDVNFANGVITSIEVQHTEAHIGYLAKWVELGTNFAVDSGQIGIFDLGKYPKNDTGEYDDEKSFYGKACKATECGESSGVVNGMGFVSCTAYGDGSYTAEGVKNEDNELIAVRIVFSDDVDEYDESYDEDDDEEEYED